MLVEKIIQWCVELSKTTVIGIEADVVVPPDCAPPLSLWHERSGSPLGGLTGEGRL